MADEGAPNLEPGDVHWLFAGPKQNALDALDHSPDDAGRAVQLAQATDSDPNLVYTNLDTYERQAKAAASSGIIDQNHYIRQFLTDPIAAKLTNDDLGNLDGLSQSMQALRKSPILEGLKAFGPGFVHGMGPGGIGSWISPESFEKHPLSSAAWSVLASPLEGALRIGGGLITGTTETAAAFAKTVAMGFGLNENQAERIGGELGEAVALQIMGLNAPKGVGPLQIAEHNKALELGSRIEPWMSKGELPPVGVDPAVDKVHVELATQDQESLREALKAMAKTNLRERSPEFAAKFAGQVVSGDIEISRDAVAKLYGDKPPEPEDGLLGWVPDIAQQLQGTGDIRVPLADYLGKVDPKVAKELEDGVRVRPEGLAPEEAKNYEAPEAQPAMVGDAGALQSLRGAAALEPTKGKSFSIDLAESTPEGRHAFDIKDAEGASIGELYIAEEDGGKRLYIDDIRSAEGSQSIGSRAIRRAAKQLFAQFPLAEELRGMRVSGAREKANERYSDMVIRREQVEKAEPTSGFKTAKGSTYVLHDDGTTTRNKAARSDIGHEGDSGIKDRTEKTVYVNDAKLASALSAAGLQGLGSKGARVIIKDGKASLLTWNEEAGRWGRSASSTDIEISDAPGLGKAPLELWKKADDVPGYEAYRGMHAGNEIIEITSNNTTSPAFEGAAPGLTKAQTDKYQKLIQKRQDEDREFLRAQEEKLAARQASKEYRARKNELRGEVAEEIGARSDVDLEDRLRRGLRLDPESLTETQRAALPKEWLAEGGLRADDVAASLGTDVGVLDRAAAVAAQREASKLGPIPFRRSLVEAEVERRALAETRKVALDDIWDHVVSETQEEILHEQTMALAEAAGEAYPIKPDAIREAVLEEVRGTPARLAKEAGYLAEAGRAGRKLEDAALAGDIAEQFRQSQAQQIAFIKARLAKDFAKVASETEALAKKYSKREVKGTLPEYTNAIHSILQKVGGKIGRRPEDLVAENAALGYTDLPDFLAKKEAEYAVMQLQIPVADFLLDPGYAKDIKDLSVGEVQGLHQSIKSLDHLGRSENKLEMAGQKYERQELVEQMATQLKEKFAGGAKPMEGKSLATRFTRQFAAAMHGVDTVFRRFDGRDPEGIFTKFFIYPGARAMNGENALQRELAGKYRDLGRVEKPKELVEHDFVDPVFGGKRKINRGTLDNIIANVGNKYNRDRAAHTLGVEPEQLMAWVEANTKPEDIARAQKRGDSIWKWLKGQDDNVYRNLYGVAPENIALDGFSMHGQNFDGWYHPIIVDRERSLRADKFERDPTTKPTNFWPSVRNSFTKRRTGAIDNLSFEPGHPELVMAQMIHDISLREYVNDASKVLLDNSFRLAITRNYGAEYHDIMRQWVYNVAGNRSFNEDALTTGAKVSNFFRQNVISTYIAFNIAGTLFKHGPTAAIMSSREVNAAQFLKNSFRTYIGDKVKPEEYGQAFLNTFGKDPALGDSIWGFTKKYSEEIQRRERHYQDTLTGVHDIVFGKPTLRNKIMQWGAQPVALSDMLSAVPLWFTKYQEVLGETGDHPTAVQRADLAVRSAHGSTGEMSRPLIAANNSALAPWFTSLYGFFGANMQRKIELMHDVNDSYKLGREGEIKEMAKMIPGITASTLAYVIAPVAVEEAVTSQFTEDKRGVGHKALNFTLLALTNSIIGLRDFAWGVEHGMEPSAGLVTSPLHDTAQLFRDLGKPRPMSKQNAGKLVQDSLTAFGDATGMMPKPIARGVRFGIDIANRQQRPRTAGDYWRGVTSGQAQRRIEK